MNIIKLAETQLINEGKAVKRKILNIEYYDFKMLEIWDRAYKIRKWLDRNSISARKILNGKMSYKNYYKIRRK